MSDLKNVNLQVAQFALESVKEVLNYDEKEKKKDEKKQELASDKYKTFSKKMPVLIQKNGLIGTLVFILSKVQKEKSHGIILSQIKKWCEENPKLEFLKDKLKFNKKNEDFVGSITNLSNQEYRLLTKEMINLFAWIKRFSDGMIEGESGND